MQSGLRLRRIIAAADIYVQQCGITAGGPQQSANITAFNIQIRHIHSILPHLITFEVIISQLSSGYNGLTGWFFAEKTGIFLSYHRMLWEETPLDTKNAVIFP
jgi:hypothetical protein